MTRIVLLLLFTLLLLGCNKGRRGTIEVYSNKLTLSTDELDRQVISDYLNTQLNADPPDARPLLICSDTFIGPSASLEIVVNRLGSQQVKDLIDDYGHRNSSSRHLDDKLSIDHEYRWVSQADLTRLTKGKVGYDFYQSIKSNFGEVFGPLSFSSPGYNDEKNRAMFFFSRSGADGRFVIMRFENKQWVVENEAFVYIV